MKKSFLMLIASIIIFCKAEPQSVRFGDIDIQDLEMRSYPKDTSASAVVLYNYGHFNSSLLQFTHIQRIKILKKEGYSWADQTFPGRLSGNLRGVTVNLENGKVVKSKLKAESIFTNEVTRGVFETRVTMPDVHEGSVLELEFKYQGIPNEWRFQEKIPVRYSELKIEDSPNVRFSSNFFGFESLSSSSPGHWIAKDMPAFREEPYINSLENYIVKREFDLLEIRFPGFIKVYAASWEDINSELLHNTPNFTFTFPLASQLNEITRSIKESGASGTELIKSAFDASKIIKWNGYESLYTSDPSLSYVMKLKSGNSADVNAFLYQILKNLGVKVYPVAISTRKNGLISQVLPSLTKLNYMVVAAIFDGEAYILDATEKYAPFNLIPLRCLNGQGRVVDEEKCVWIDIKTDATEKEVIKYDLTLTSDLSLAGKLTTEKVDYSALEHRKKYFGFNSREEYLNDFGSGKPGLLVNSYDVRNIDSIYLPVTEEFDIEVSHGAMQLGNELHIQPMLFNQLSENPFRSETRKYPVDFGYGRDITIITNITVPDGFSVKSLPTPIKYEIPLNTASFSYQVEQKGNRITITSRQQINKPLFLMNEYAGLRKFFDAMIRKQSEPVILTKSSAI